MTRALRATLWVGVLGLALVLDGPVARGLRWPDAADQDWGRALRIVGFLPTWMVVGWGLQRVDGRWQRGLRVMAAAALAGLGAEVIKLVARRQRPGPAGEVSWQPWAQDTWSTAGLGFPSSHAAVAFGGALMLGAIAPRLRLPALLLAAGCGLSRMLAGAHFLSDVVGAALVAALVTWGLQSRWPAPGQNPDPPPVD